PVGLPGRTRQMGAARPPSPVEAAVGGRLAQRRIDRVLLRPGAERPGDVGDQVIVEVDDGRLVNERTGGRRPR
ncbi:MAG TPA: hypothetical protein VGU21_05780, partial [Streptosporangiaceae bacterium]|nr:hypothetical protein [Streptosporangiaceae bacterium]